MSSSVMVTNARAYKDGEPRSDACTVSLQEALKIEKKFTTYLPILQTNQIMDKPGTIVSYSCTFPGGRQTRKQCFLAMFHEGVQTRKHCFLVKFPEHYIPAITALSDSVQEHTTICPSYLLVFLRFQQGTIVTQQQTCGRYIDLRGTRICAPQTCLIFPRLLVLFVFLRVQCVLNFLAVFKR